MKELNVEWIDALNPGDLIRVKTNLGLSSRGSNSIDVDKDETMLLMGITPDLDRVTFTTLLRGEIYASSLKRDAFDRAFSLASSIESAKS